MSKDKQDKRNILQKELSTKEILVVLGICGTFFAYGYFFIYPKYSEYKSVSNNLQNIELEINKYENSINEMPIKTSQLEDLEREIKVKSRILSYNMEDGMFLIGLSKLMNDLDVELIEYSMEEVVQYNNFNAIPTKIALRGDYKHIREIMYYLEEQKNMTQVLDYNMEVYIPEKINEQSNTTTIVPDSVVYWTNEGNAYHRYGCEIFKSEVGMNIEKILSGKTSESNKGAACQVCKPYTVNQVNNTLQGENEKPKSTGLVEAEFKFIMYSSENPRLELENDDSSKWKPGKYNPFKTTTR